nr:hypothetical protein [uncultured Arsenicibacter sp.]
MYGSPTPASLSAIETLDFSHNWNNKLDGQYYTTFRLRSKKFQPGRCLKVTLNKEPHHIAQIVETRYLKLAQVNAWVAGLDTGYSLPEFVQLVKTMYKNIVKDFDTQEFVLVLLKKIPNETI